MRQQPTQQPPQWSRQELATAQYYQPVQQQPAYGASQSTPQQVPKGAAQTAQRGLTGTQQTLTQPARTAQQGLTGTQQSLKQPAQAGQQGSTAAQQSDQTGPQVGGQGSMGQPMVQTTQPQAREPAVDVLETPDELLVLVDLAGFDQDDIQLDVDNDVLRIAASRTLAIDEEETLLAQERLTRFERYLQLPVEANIEDASATHEDGVCRITLPKSEQARGSHHRIGFQ